jgi:hypothetical protein
MSPGLGSYPVTNRRVPISAWFWQMWDSADVPSNLFGGYKEVALNSAEFYS